nr:exonuclease SbcCD subunit D [uncultured Catonella sp.]
MRFFHISDLHIGLKLINKDLSEDQCHILNEIVKEVGIKKPEAVVIAGDIYDKSAPTAEAIEIFDNFISALVATAPDMSIMIISGNHDNAIRINQFRTVLAQHKLHLVGLPPKKADEYIEKVTFNDEYGEINFYLLPYVRPTFVRNVLGLDENENNLSYNEAIHKLIDRENMDENVRNILVSHQYYVPVGKNPEEIDRMDSEIVSVGNIDMVEADVLKKFDYAALGHIHKPWKLFGDFHRYSGTPMACSVSEAGQEKGIVMVELLEKGRINTEVIPLNPLRRVRTVKGSLGEVLKEPSDDYVSVVLTDRETDDIDVRARIRDKFPNFLEIIRESTGKNAVEKKVECSESLSEIENCKIFLNDLNEEEEKILNEIINELKEV